MDLLRNDFRGEILRQPAFYWPLKRYNAFIQENDENRGIVKWGKWTNGRMVKWLNG